MTRKSIGYIRQSRRADLDVALSYDTQLAAIQRLANDPSIEILSDMGRSGGKGKEHLRPGYQELLRRLEADEVSAVYALNLSRLARSVPELHRLMTLAKTHGVKVVTSKEGQLDPTTTTGRLTFGVFALLAEFVRDLAVDAALENAEERRKRGEVMGRAAYGARPGESVQAVIDAFRQAGTYSGAARVLNAAGMKSSLGRLWKPASVKMLIEREAPEIAPRNPAPGVAPTGGFRLSRLLRCGHDGYLLTGAHDSRRIGISYRCHGADGNSGHPHPRSVSEAQVMEWVAAEAARYREPQDASGVTEGQRAAELAEWGQKRARVVEMRTDGLIDRHEARERLAVIDREIDARVPKPLLAMQSAERDGRRVKLIDLPDWTTLPAPEVNAMLRSLWEHIELGPDLRPVRAIWWSPETRSAD